MRKRLMIAIATASLFTVGFAVAPKGCNSAIASHLAGMPCCYQANGVSYSSTYGSDDKCKKPSSLPWYKCMVQVMEAIA